MSKNLSTRYYQKQIKALKKACGKYQDLPVKEKNKKQ